MKKFFFFVSLLVVAFFPGKTFASQHSFEIAFQNQYLSYKESSIGLVKNEQEGFQQGARLAYEYDGVDSYAFIRLEFNFAYGESDFKGADSGGTPIQKTTFNTLFSTEFDLGFSFYFKGFSLPITFYTGVGMALWNRQMGAPNSFGEYYSYGVFPVGVRTCSQLGSFFTLEGDLALLYLFAPSVKFRFSELDPTFNNPGAEMGDGFSVRIRISFSYYFYGPWCLFLTPWYEYKYFGKSSTEVIRSNGVPLGTVFKPANEAHGLGCYFGFKVQF